MVTPDPNERMFFPRLRRQAKLFFSVLAVAIIGIFVIVTAAKAGVLEARKEKLPRDDVYYEITNDKDDHGNFIETYHLPNGRGGKVYCVVYSDKIGKSGGGAGISCDWENSR